MKRSMASSVNRIFLLIVSAMIVVSGCTEAARAEHSAHMDREKVIEIANRAAKEAAADLTKFKAPEAYFEYVKKDWSWAVFYEGIEPTIGNHFLVVVDDRTGHATMVGGL